MHVLGKFINECDAGSELFPNTTIEQARAGLKQALSELSVPRADAAHLQDMRRGHSEDIRAAGGGDEVLRVAGGWKRKSRAILYYLDLEQLELESCMKAHGPGADSGPEDD